MIFCKQCCSYYLLYNVEGDSLCLLYLPLPQFLQILPRGTEYLGAIALIFLKPPNLLLQTAFLKA